MAIPVSSDECGRILKFWDEGLGAHRISKFVDRPVSTIEKVVRQHRTPQHRAPRDNPWTDEMVSTLRRMWRDGASASDIASVIGMSRNQVSGKLSRLGLRRIPGAKCEEPSGTQRQPIRSESAAAEDRFVVPAVHISAEPTPYPRPPIPSGVGSVPEVYDIPSRHQCHFPIGDPQDSDFRWCRAPTVTARGPYCEHHARATVDREATVESAKATSSADKEAIKLMQRQIDDHQLSGA